MGKKKKKTLNNSSTTNTNYMPTIPVKELIEIGYKASHLHKG